MSVAGNEQWQSEVERLRARMEHLEQRLADYTRVEQELRDSEERWRSLVENAPDVILLLDREGRIQFINRTATGYDESEVVGSAGTDFIQPEQREGLELAVQRVVETGQPAYYEIQDIRNEWWYAVRLAPVRRGGRVESVVAISTDITERKQQVRALRDSESRLELAIEGSHGGLWILDLDPQQPGRCGDDIYLSPQLKGFIGFADHEFPNSLAAWNGRILPEDLPALQQSAQDHLAGRTPRHEAEYRVRHKDGSLRWIYTRGMVQRDAKGQPIRFAGIDWDITQRKEYEQTLQMARDELEHRVAERTRELRTVNRLLREDILKHDKLEQELREGEQRFRTIAETIPVPVLISRISDGLILYADRRLGELLDVPLESLVGQNTPDFYAETADRRRLFDLMKKDGRVRNFETQLKRPDGTRRWVSISLAPISYRGQEAVLGVLVDISHIKQAEESLRSERRLLKRMLDVNERDRKLIAYEIHDGMVQDLAGAAMLLESCQDTVPEEHPDARHNFSNALRLVRNSINEARRMINGLQPPILEDAGLIPALEGFVAEMTATAELTIEFTHDVKFDRIAPALEMAIYRIVQEALNNVWQHSKSPKARVKLVQTGRHVEISVRDWGVGFDPDKIKKKRYGLIGMRERARLLGGTASISSKPGEGTRITVKLPVTDLLLTEGKPDDDSDSRIGVLRKP